MLLIIDMEIKMKAIPIPMMTKSPENIYRNWLTLLLNGSGARVISKFMVF